MTPPRGQSPENRRRGIFVCSTFPTPQQPGQGLVNAIQLRALSRHMQFVVLSPHRYFPFKAANALHPPVGSQREYEGIPVTDAHAWYLPMVHGPINGRLYALSIRRALAGLCASFRPDFLLTSWTFPDTVAVAQEAKRLGLPLMTIVRGTDVHLYCTMPARWAAVLEALHYASVVIARGQSLAYEVIKGGIPKEKVHVVYNGVDQQTFRPRDRNETARALDLPVQRRRVLCVASFWEVKLVPVLIEAFAEMIRAGNTDTDLVLIGDGPERPIVDRLIAQHQFGDRLRLLNERPHAEVAQWMAACDVVCLPSRNEGIPNVILEAFACGRPVVASRAGGIPEIVREGETALLAPPGDRFALASTLTAALTRTWDASLIRQSVARFDWGVNARAVCGLIQDALPKGQP
jgi:glycosyltransferase involved in cell wall biosynthesis